VVPLNECQATEVDLGTIKEWLVSGEENPKTIVDLRWEILEETRDKDGRITGLRAAHPAVPLRLLILELPLSDDKKAIRIVVETNIPTADLPPEEKLILYRLLLDWAKAGLVKIYIFGLHHEIAVASDLSPKNLTKEEFDDALISILSTVLALARFEALSKYIIASEYAVLSELLRRWYREGLSEEEARKRLEDAGVSKEVVDKYIETIYGEKETRKEATLHI